MDDCIFCKIVRGEVPSAKIWEDNDFLAFLDAFPNTPGMTLVVPKEHHHPDIFTLEDEFIQGYFLAAKRVAELLKKALKVERVALIIEGLGIDHAHFKLYPLHGVDAGTQELRKEVFFEKYPGYLTSLSGPRADIDELNRLAEKIRLHS